MNEPAVDLYDEDEIEAESLLDEINLIDNINKPIELKQTILNQTNTITNEIIDFLLQWEEVDDNTTSSSNINTNNKIRNTIEILESLNQVEEELLDVDIWLSNQINSLDYINDNLKLIEDESGGIESSWSNMKVLYNIINIIINKLTISQSNEIILMNPENIINQTIKSNDFNYTSDILSPLVQSIKLLYEAHTYKGIKTKKDVEITNENDVNISTTVWKQIRTIKAIEDQKNHISQLIDSFTKKITICLPTIFTSILKHKYLNDDSSNHSINTKSFLLNSFISNSMNQTVNNTKYFVYSERVVITSIPNDKNMLLYSQRLYHEILSDYIPLIEIVVTITPPIKTNLMNAYVDITIDKLYNSLFKLLYKEMKNLLATKRLPMTLNNINKYIYAQTNSFEIDVIKPSSKSIRVNESTSNILVNSWDLFHLYLLLVTPVIAREESFFMALFSIDSDNNNMSIWKQLLTDNNIDSNTSTIPNKSDIDNYLSKLYNNVYNIIIKLLTYSSTDDIVNNVSTGGDIDIIELISIYSIYQQFVRQYVITTNPDIQLTNYTLIFLYDIKQLLNNRIQSYLSDQIKWIQLQKVDVKKYGISLPFLKYIALVYHISDIIQGQIIEVIDNMLITLSQELFTWLTNISNQNIKYSDIFKLKNLCYYEITLTTISQSTFPSLKKFISYVISQRIEVESRYIVWMVSYEFPSLSDLAVRLEGVGNRVREEELALYIRRKDVQNVVKELDLKTLELSISTMRKRLEKHCDNTDDQDLKLLSDLWKKIKNKTVDIVKKLELAALASYQITLDIGPQIVAATFDKFA